MSRRTGRLAVCALLACATVLGYAVPPAVAVPYEFVGPVFGLAAGTGDVLFAADSGAGIARLQGADGRLAVELPGAVDAAPIRPGRMWAVSSGPGIKKVFWVVRGHAREIANLGRYEKRRNPDGGEIDSNPFDVAAIGGGRVLVADAGANAVLSVNRRGTVNWIATLPDEIVSTENIKTLAGCPDAPDELAEFCDLPDEMPAQGVATSVAIGPDGAYYVTELKGFPAPTGESRVWRIEPGTRHAHCEADAEDSPCSVVADGFTSIVDITFDAEGTAHVVELDEASWFAVEVLTDAAQGGTVNACDSTTWVCTEEASGLPMPMAVASNETGTHVVVSALLPESVEVMLLT
jgi:hypothetical protein